jgi:hypothetical protein
MVTVNPHPLDSVIRDLATKYICGLLGADHAPVRRNTLLEPVGLEENEFTSVTEELPDGSAALIWFDIIDEEQDEWRDMNVEIRKLSSLSTLNSIPCPAKLPSRSVPRSPSHHVRHRSFSPCNRLATVALPSPYLASRPPTFLVDPSFNICASPQLTFAVNPLRNRFGCSNTFESLGFLRVSRLLLCFDFGVPAIFLHTDTQVFPSESREHSFLTGTESITALQEAIENAHGAIGGQTNVVVLKSTTRYALWSLLFCTKLMYSTS